MEQPQPKLPNEAIELYNLYIHGEIDRRDFLSGISKVRRRRPHRRRDRRRADAELRARPAGVEDRRADQGELRHDSLAAGQRQHQGLSRAARSADTREATAGKLPGHSRRAREPRAESAHRGHRAASGARQLHGVRARRAHVARRLPGRRCQGRAAVQQGRQREDDRRLRGGGACG